jgi:hypothetical protein
MFSERSVASRCLVPTELEQAGSARLEHADQVNAVVCAR